jgi:RNA polymerase sigma-70 factor (ECF subfamily)
VTFDDPAWLAQERQWLDALRGGDGRAWTPLYQAFSQPLYRRILLPRLGDPAAAEDALAETFRKAFERLDRWEDRGKGLWPYLATIAANQAHDMHRARGRGARALASFEAMLAPLAEGDGPADGAGADPDAGRLRGAIDRALAAINPRYRRALELRFFEDRSREECAARLEVKVPTFDVLLLRALRAFRQEWQEMYGARTEAP